MTQGRELGVKLANLWHAGKTLIPEVATQFDGAYDGIQAGNESYPWYRGGGLGRGMYGAHAEYMELSATLGGYIARTYNNLYYTGEALVTAADNFEGADQAARAEFESRKRQLGGG